MNSESKVDSSRREKGRVTLFIEQQKKKKGDDDLATFPAGETVSLVRFKLYDPQTSIYLEAAGPLLLSRELNARRQQIKSALQRLSVITLPSGHRVALLKLTSTHKPPVVEIGEKGNKKKLKVTSSTNTTHIPTHMPTNTPQT